MTCNVPFSDGDGVVVVVVVDDDDVNIVRHQAKYKISCDELNMYKLSGKVNTIHIIFVISTSTCNTFMRMAATFMETIYSCAPSGEGKTGSAFDLSTQTRAVGRHSRNNRVCASFDATDGAAGLTYSIKIRDRQRGFLRNQRIGGEFVGKIEN